MKLILFFATILVVFSSCKVQNTTKETPIPNSIDVLKITEKVANWQIETFEDMGKYKVSPSKHENEKWLQRTKSPDLDWACTALYSGMFELTKVSHYPKYINWLVKIGDRNNWKLPKHISPVDDLAFGQLYLSLNQNIRLKNMVSIEPTKARFDSIMNNDKDKVFQWNSCDALFMAPPVWTRLSKVTKDSAYLEYMDKHYKKTYEELWDIEELLFYRDKKFLKKGGGNRNKIFSSQGNGLVFAGLAFMIPDFPKDWKGKSFYETLFIKMARRLKETQRKDGTWSAGILGDVEVYPNVETSGSAFFTFGIAWGINNGLLDKETYEPVLFKSWYALIKSIDIKGMLRFAEPINTPSGVNFRDYTEVYSIGAFLAAGSELRKYLNKFHPLPKDDKHEIFMKDGGWCWYQDPRALISNGKLIMSGLSGQNGDARIGVYDLASEKMDGTNIIHKELGADDHNVPALYKRPDNSILAVWAKHSAEKIHYYSISEPNNYFKWGTTEKFEHKYDHKNGVTYMNLYYLKNQGKLYNFFRSGATYNPSFITSENHGKSWGNPTHFIANDIEGYQRPYARYYQIDEDTIGISYTDGHPRRYGNNLFYVEFSNDTFYKVDGTKIKSLSNGPLRSSDGEKIYIGSDTSKKSTVTESVPFSAWTCAMGKDQKNNPHIGYTLYINDADHRFRIASWDGDTWNDREIAYAGKCLYKIESSYTGLMAFDPEDPRKVYISTDVDPSTGKDLGGVHEIYEAIIEKGDTVNNIKWKPITSNSNYRNIRPIVVADEGYKVLLWLNGPWNTFKDYNADVRGIILEKK